MPAKLIFLHSKFFGRDTFRFCPLVEYGCDKCFFRELGCEGESDINIAFDLSVDWMTGEYILEPIKESNND